MSFFGGLFGKSKKEPKYLPKPTANDTIKNMKKTQELLRKKQAVMEASINAEKDNAKRLVAASKTNPRKKTEALRHLKKAKMYETQFNQLDNQILTLDQTIFAMEKAMVNEEIINSQKQANTVLKQQIAGMDAVDVEEMFMDQEELVDEVNEIGEVLGQGVDFGNFDDDEIEAELDDLLNDGDDVGVTSLPAMPAVPSTFDMPVVPTRQDLPDLPVLPQPKYSDSAYADLEDAMAI